MDIKDMHKNKSFVLILDPESLHLCSTLVKMNDLLKMGISIIEKLDVKRKKMEKYYGIYFVTPCQDTINYILEDFSNDQVQYGKVHLYFTRKLSKELLI
jgi:syntaxin-binding protein 1